MLQAEHALRHGKRLFLRIRNRRHVVSIHISPDGKNWKRGPRGYEVSGYHQNVRGGFMSLKPALYAAGKFDSRRHGKAFVEEKRKEYEAQHYHQPSDEYDPKADLRGAEQDARLLFRVGQRLAQETTFPQWKPGSEFRAIREQSRPRQ